MKSANTIVIIPARGGSKRLSGKNLLLLAGKSLLAHSIEYAQGHSWIDAILVSTDNDEIKKEAQKLGAEVIHRPLKLSGDHAPVITAMQHVLEQIEAKPENVILLQPTNPLRPEKLLEQAFTVFNKGSYDSLMTVSPHTRKLGKIENHKFIPFNYKMGQRSQEMEPMYFENGLLYITKAEVIREGKILADNNFAFITEHPFGNIDIDTEEDFLKAQFYLSMFKNK
jgi:CMP-N-acetylneuraminic acid synthetase